MKVSIVDLLNKIGILLVIAVMAFAVYTLFFDEPFYQAESYYPSSDGQELDSGTIRADRDVDEIELKNVSGKIYVEHGDDSRVNLSYQKFGPGKPPEVEISYQGSRMIIKAVYPKVSGSFGSVDLHATIPSSVEYINAGSVSGSIRISDNVNGIAQKLNTTSGSIETESSTDLEASSVSGSIRFSSTGESIDISTTSGRIAGVLEDDNEALEIELSSVSGSISLEVPEDLDADVDLHSVSGSVSSELPVSSTESKRKSLKGRIGNGGTIIDIGTVSGAIRIKK